MDLFAADEVLSAINLELGKLKTLNVILVGKTGVGKSTLINSLLNKKVAATGTGRPITQTTHCYTSSDNSLNLYDTKGFELSLVAQEEVLKAVKGLVTDGVAAKNINKSIHSIFYCINAQSSRIEDKEIEWLGQFTRTFSVLQVPVFVIITQAFAKKKAEALRQFILEQKLGIKDVVLVLGEKYEINEDVTIEPYGLQQLTQSMKEKLPGALEQILREVQVAVLKEKKAASEEIIHWAAGAAAAAAATPIPFSDAAVLVPVQVAMIGKITSLYDIDLTKSVITGIVSAMAGTAGATYLGRTIVTGLIKLIPGAGTIVGGMISAGTAVALTEAMGHAYNRIMIKVYIGEIDASEIGSRKFIERLKEELEKL